MRYIFYTLLGFFLLFGVTLNAQEREDSNTTILRIEGQKHFTLTELEEVAGGVSQKHFWQSDEGNYTIDRKLIPSLEMTLKQFYASEGFYTAKVTLQSSSSYLLVKIDEGLPVRVSEIKIESNYPIASLIPFKKGDIFRAKAFIASKNNIITQLINDGYCSYSLDTKAYVDIKKHTVSLVYLLDKGGVCRFGETTIKGLEGIDAEIVRSRVVAKKGERFDPKKLKESYAGIYGLDAFDSVLIHTDRKFYNEVPVDIDVQMLTKPYHYEVGAGYDTFVGARVHGSLTKRNFLGNAQKVHLRASWSQKEQLLSAKLIKPDVFSLWDFPLDLGSSVGYSNLEYTGFQEKKGYLNTYLEHNEGRLKAKLGWAFENIDITLLSNLSENEELEQAVKAGNFVLFYPYLNLVYDKRDDPLNPKYGYYLRAYLEYGLPLTSDASAYLKTLFEGRYIDSFGDLTLAGVAKVGTIEKGIHDIPESKYFFAGGSYYNRAYGYNKLGVILSPTEDTIHGGSTLLNFSFEADYPIVGELYGALFSDNTMLTESSYDFSGEYVQSVGVGVRYMTPIGPFKLDVGWNIYDRSIYGISFQIGQSF